MTPGKGAANVQIVEVTLVVIGLALKRDVAVGIAAHGDAHHPFHEIEEIEEHKEHLTLLGRVDALMVDQLVAQIDSMMHKEHPQQVDSREPMEWQY